MNPVLFSRATIRFLRVDDTVASTHNLYAPIETKQRVTRSIEETRTRASRKFQSRRCPCKYAFQCQSGRGNTRHARDRYRYVLARAKSDT